MEGCTLLQYVENSATEIQQKWNDGYKYDAQANNNDIEQLVTSVGQSEKNPESSIGSKPMTSLILGSTLLVTTELPALPGRLGHSPGNFTKICLDDFTYQPLIDAGFYNTHLVKLRIFTFLKRLGQWSLLQKQHNSNKSQHMKPHKTVSIKLNLPKLARLQILIWSLERHSSFLVWFTNSTHFFKSYRNA